MTDALEDYKASVSIGGKTVSNIRFADAIDSLDGSETELAELILRVDQSFSIYGMEIMIILIVFCLNFFQNRQ